MTGSPKILCISLGSIGKRHLRNARELLPNAQIAVWRQHTSDSTISEGADAMLQSAQEALDFAPDAVLVSSPASEHIANAMPFAERDVPLFIEKPLAASCDGIEPFLRQCAQSKGFIMVGYVLRFLPALHAIRTLMEEGALGEVYTAHVQVGQYLPDWRPASDYRTGVSAQAKLGGGALLELSHEIDYATWLFGWPRSLQCSRARLSSLEIDVEDSAHLILEYEKRNVLVQLDFLQRVAKLKVQAVGSKATLEADILKEELVLFSPGQPEGTRWPCEKLPNGNDMYLRQFDCFLHHALKGYQPRYAQTKTFADWATVDQAAGVLQLVDLAKKASDSGMRQNIPQKKAKAA